MALRGLPWSAMAISGYYAAISYFCRMDFSGKTVAFHTLGCKLNFSETSAIARLMQEKGFSKLDFNAAADVYVINTCSVTENADRECRSVVKGALARNPNAFIAVIGCYAQLKPDEISGIEGVDVVLGATEKFRLLNYIHFSGKAEHALVHNCEIGEADFFVGAYSSGAGNDRTRSFLKVQDGCDYSCAVCTIPLARGKSRSDTVENVLANARAIAANGVSEIVLTGVNTGDFGYGEFIGEGERKRRQYTFLDLIQELDKLGEISRFRISSIEPNLLSPAIIDFVADSRRFAPHFHIPLQSGSNSVLRRMKRRYQRELYAERVAHIRQRMPHCCIGVDVITGFPGETEEEFLETYNFINALEVSYLHVFTYSERDNTEAVALPDPVPMAERKRRTKMLRILSAKKLRQFYDQQRDRELSAIFEYEDKNGFMYGFTENYVRVKRAYDRSLCNRVLTVRLLEPDEAGDMTCSVLSAEHASLA